MSAPVMIVKCPCGDGVCSYYWVSDGSFHQGTGWSKERAQQYADAINEADRAREVRRNYTPTTSFGSSGGRCTADNGMGVRCSWGAGHGGRHTFEPDPDLRSGVGQ